MPLMSYLKTHKLMLAVFGGLALVYFLTASGRVGTIDADLMLKQSRSLLAGTLAINDVGLLEGADGQRYSHFGILTSIWWVPFVLLGRGMALLLPLFSQGMWEEFAVSFASLPLALLLLALGVLGLARLQVGALTESRNTNARAIAVQMAADLSERMQSNSTILRNNPAPNPYETDWGAPLAAGPNCLTSACAGAELAAFDVRTWKLNLQALLPNGDAQIFRSNTDTNQFGVLMRWAEFPETLMG